MNSVKVLQVFREEKDSKKAPGTKYVENNMICLDVDSNTEIRINSYLKEDLSSLIGKEVNFNVLIPQPNKQDKKGRKVYQFKAIDGLPHYTYAGSENEPDYHEVEDAENKPVEPTPTKPAVSNAEVKAGEYIDLIINLHKKIKAELPGSVSEEVIKSYVLTAFVELSKKGVL